MDTVETIDAAQAATTFDVLAFIENTAYPTSEVVVFQDVKSADEYVKLINERVEYDKAGKDWDVADDEKIEALGVKISDSAIVFELRGMPPGIVSEILKVNTPDDEEIPADIAQERDNELVAKTIIGAKNAKGVQDTHVWSAEDIAKLRKFLKEGEFGKLLKGVSEVNFNAMVFDQATDAGFSGRRSDVAE